MPTLVFQVWSEKEGIRHSYFEKSMRSQILTMKRSSQSEHSKCSILVNELIRRFEVLDGQIDIDEKIQIIDHYTQQLINSGYTGEQARDLIESGLKGMKRKEERKLKRGSRFRSAEETKEERETKKLIEATTWFKEKEKDENEEIEKEGERKSEGEYLVRV